MLKCYICHKSGHKSENCTENKNEVENANNAENISLYASHKDSLEETAFNSTSVINQRDWCLDSGCTTHLCKNIEDFNEIVDTNIGKLNLASNSSTEIKAKENIILISKLSGRAVNVNINNASHVPDLRTNLLSVEKITDQGMTVIFGKDHARVINKNGQDINC